MNLLLSSKKDQHITAIQLFSLMKLYGCLYSLAHIVLAWLIQIIDIHRVTSSFNFYDLGTELRRLIKELMIE
jgi:hypothetical protein